MLQNERLKMLRERKGFTTKKQFACHAQKHGLDVGLRRYEAIERGDVKPDINEIIAICSAMDISADDWLFGSERVLGGKLASQELQIIETLAESLIRLRIGD
jgi:transcriptional regulator with XRE-family HTH domain